MEPMEPEVKKVNPFLVPFSIVVAGALVGAGIYLSQNTPAKSFVKSGTDSQKSVDEVALPAITPEDHILGNPNAQVTIVEYSDTECPFCKSFHQTMHRIIDEYGKDGRVAWIYRHFPIASLHSKAPNEAMALECAAELGGNDGFWKYTDQVYSRTDSNNTLDSSELPKIAKDTGLDVKKFNDCLTSGKYAQKVASQVVDAQKAGAEGTPHSVLVTKGGQKIAIKGAQPYDVMKSVIDAALSQGASTQ